MEATDGGNNHAEDTPVEEQEDKLVILNGSSELPDEVIDRDIIDEDGDVLVKTNSNEMLVSSKLLALASPVFKAMFNSKFREGSTIRSVQKPLELPLPDDNPDALTVLFHTLHFSSKRTFHSLGADLQLHVAQSADKYQCTTSISGESGRWLRSLSKSDQATSTLWTLSTIAFLMGRTDEFSNITAKLVLKSTAAELDHAAPNSALPETFKGALHRLRTRVICGIMGVVEAAIDELRVSQQEYETGGKLCTICRKYKPPPTKKCHGCQNSEFFPIYCDAGSRIRKFFELLSSVSVWPLSQQMENSPVAFQSKLDSIKNRLDHNCYGHNRCPLSHVVKTLKDVIGGFMTQTEGLDLRAFQTNTYSDEGGVPLRC